LNGIQPLGVGGSIEWLRFSSRGEYLQALDAQQQVFAGRWLWGQHLSSVCGHSGYFRGFCSLCQQATDFQFSAAPGQEVNLREEMSCLSCGLNARVRALLGLLGNSDLVEDSSRIYMTEQTTLLYKFVRDRWANVKGSEYFGPEAKPRLVTYIKHLISEHEQLRHEDVTELSFDDQALDIIISCDVLEHVPDYGKALNEFARVLSSGGRLLLTVPFMDGDEKTLVRARLTSDGSIEHLEPPEYHGDPIDPQGVLACYSFGWDLLDDVREAGFSKAEWCLPWSPSEGLFTSLWTLEAIK